MNYELYMQPANQGMLADSMFTDKNSFAAEGVVGFGLALVSGTDPVNQVKIPTASGQVFMGISIASLTTVQDATGNGGYKDTATVSVLRRGRIWVAVTGAVTANLPAYFVYSGADAGKFSNSNTGAQIVPTGVWRTSTTGAGIALLEINLPASDVSFMDKSYTVAEGIFTTTAGSATQTITISGLVSTDIPFVQLQQVGATPRTIISATCSANTLTVVMSGDPSNDHVIAYQVRRDK